MQPAPQRSRIPANQRRLAIIEVGGRIFAEKGFYGTSTADVAAAAGISHAYLFRLFPTKTQLFTACCEDAFARTHEALARGAQEARAAGGDGQAVLDAMGGAYLELLEDRNHALGMLNAQAAACSQPEIRDVVLQGFSRLVGLVASETGLEHDAIRRFFAQGMLLNTLTSIRADENPDEWVAILCE
jgi:AcrR family transcriptional regulator